MSRSVPRQPTLFTASDDARPRIHARRCACGHVFHPPHGHGCEVCGSALTEAVELEARGKLVAFATVFAHPSLPTPFVLGRVWLDQGPVIDAWLEVSPNAIEIGQRVSGVLVESGQITAEGSTVDCRFVRELP